MSQKQFVMVNGLRLAYIDFGGDGPPLLAVHGHFGCGRMFARLAEALRGQWRVIAPDLRGHGWSDAPEDYSREAYVADLAALVDHLDLPPLVMLGHSLGGQNTYVFAARHPDRVRAMIIEDMSALVAPSTFKSIWPERFGSVAQILDFLESQGMGRDPYFLESLVEHPDGWGFRFKCENLIRSMRQGEGDWWADWLATSCPALLLHGHRSGVLRTDHAREMAARRPNTQLVEFPNCGHTIHDDDPEGFYRAVRAFLHSLA